MPCTAMHQAAGRFAAHGTYIIHAVTALEIAHAADDVNVHQAVKPQL